VYNKYSHSEMCDFFYSKVHYNDANFCGLSDEITNW